MAEVSGRVETTTAFCDCHGEQAELTWRGGVGQENSMLGTHKRESQRMVTWGGRGRGKMVNRLSGLSLEASLEGHSNNRSLGDYVMEGTPKK